MLDLAQAMVRDLDDLHNQADAARRRLAAVLASSNDAIIGTDPEGRITDWNAPAEILFGYSITEMIGQPIDVLSPPDRVGEEVSVLARIRCGDVVQSFEAIRRHKDGSAIPVAVTIAPIEDAAGRLVGTFEILRDLRERDERDRCLAELGAELRHMSRLSEMGQLAAAIVHEIRQPLNAINNYVGALDRLIGSDNRDLISHAAQKIREQNDRAIGIVRRLHGFLRRSTPVVKTEDLDCIIRDAVELVAIDPAARNISIRAEPGECDMKVGVDRVQIEQVLFNLMRNAIEAMRDVPHPVLTLASRPEGSGSVSVSVADTGTGIPDDIRRNLFQPFLTTKPNGMGIGLSVSRSIIESHGGRLDIESSSERGTVFRFTLPRAVPHQPDRVPSLARGDWRDLS